MRRRSPCSSCSFSPVCRFRRSCSSEERADLSSAVTAAKVPAVWHRRRGERPRRPLRMVVAGVLALIFAFPIVWTVIGGFKPSQEANASPSVWWPAHWSVGNFTKLNSAGSSLSGYLANSCAVTIMTVALTTVAAVLAGYAFAFFRFRGKGLLFGTSVAVLLVPYPALLISLFTVMVWFGLT